METIKTLLQQGKVKDALAKFRSLSENDQEDFFRGMTPTLFPPPIVSVLFRELHPGKTFEDFYEGWTPPLKEGQDLAHYWPCPAYVMHVQNMADSSDILSIGFMWAKEEELDPFLKSMEGTESQRHSKIDLVAEKIGPSLIYKFRNMTKLGS